MKIKNVLIALAAIFLLVSCDKGNDDGIIKNSHRITQVLSDREGDNSDLKYVFTYEGENLVRITEFKKDGSGNWVDFFKSEISYSGENATEIWYNKDSTDWVIDDKSDFIITNGLMLEEYNYDYDDGSWVEYFSYIYQYSGRNLLSWLCCGDYNEDGTLEEDSKGEYTYLNSKLSQYLYYEHYNSVDWYQDYKELFFYEGGKLVNWTGYSLDESDNWVNYCKADFSYSDDKVSQIERFNYVNNQWESEDLEVYTYNSNGYLIQTTCNDGIITTYEYEAGNGNAKLFWYYPEFLLNGDPTLRSASVSTIQKRIPYYQRLKY